MRKAASSPFVKSLAGAIDYHLEQLGWNRAKLAEKSGIAQSQISAFSKGQRSMNRAHINRIAYAIAGGYENKKDSPFGINTLEIILSELLLTAGYAPCATVQLILAIDKPPVGISSTLEGK